MPAPRAAPPAAPVTPPPEVVDEEALQQAELLREERKSETELHMWEAWERHCAVYLLSCAMEREGPQGLEGLPPPFATMQAGLRADLPSLLPDLDHRRR